MKKNISIIIISCLIIYLLFTHQVQVSSSVIKSSNLFLTKVLPTILPLFIISKILINYNFPYYIAKIFHNNIYIYVFIISLISGCPNNAVIIKDLLNKNIITLEMANKYITCSFFSNPLFLYSMLTSIFDLKISILIILSHYLSNIIIYLYQPINNKTALKVPSNPLREVIINAIINASNLLVNIYITIVLFNIIITLLPSNLLNISGLIELTQGLNYLKEVPILLNGKILLALIYISFGGLSIIMQVLNVLNNTKIEPTLFIKSRFYQIIISIIIFLITSIIFI